MSRRRTNDRIATDMTAPSAISTESCEPRGTPLAVLSAMFHAVLVVGVLPILLMFASALLLRVMLPASNFKYLVSQLFPNQIERSQRRLLPDDFTWFERWGQVIGSCVPVVAILLSWTLIHHWLIAVSSLPLVLTVATYWLIGGFQVICNLTIGIGFCAFFLSQNGAVKLAGLVLLAVGAVARLVHNTLPTRL